MALCVEKKGNARYSVLSFPFVGRFEEGVRAAEGICSISKIVRLV